MGYRCSFPHRKFLTNFVLTLSIGTQLIFTSFRRFKLFWDASQTTCAYSVYFLNNFSKYFWKLEKYTDVYDWSC